MAKKNKNQRVASEELVSNAPLKNADLSSSNAVAKDVKGGKGQKNKKDKKPSAGARIRKAFKEMFSELKKVNWPTAKKTASAFGPCCYLRVRLRYYATYQTFDGCFGW